MLKFSLVIFITLFSLNTFSQTEDNFDPTEILSEFGLEISDHRGIILQFGNAGDESVLAFESLNEALYHFLSSTEKRDLTYYIITEETDLYSIDGVPLDIVQIAKYYNITSTK